VVGPGSCAAPDTWQIRAIGYNSLMARNAASRVIIGTGIATIREAIGWTQEELGARVGQTQGWVSRVENGRIEDLTFTSAERLLGAMGARLVVTVDAPHLGDRRRQREPGHSRMSAHAGTRLTRDGWQVATEVEVGGDRSRGWIDILAYHAATGILLVIELKTEIHDVGAIQRSLGWYEREAWQAARRLGWRPRHIVGCLLLLATEANDTRVADNRDVFTAAFSGRARDLDAILSAQIPPGRISRCVAMVDPRSRRRTWLRPLRIDGRRVRAPYQDYADFMRATAKRTRPSRTPHSAQ
jgi:transcriptional regulator with XRE-family HTH domain